MKLSLPLLAIGLSFASGQALHAQTAVLLKDINTTTTGVPSLPTEGVWMGANYYFAATDGINGVELWKTDGTTGNTVMLKDINTGNAASSPSEFTVVGSTLYFAANNGVNGSELWKTDGTAAGTVMVKDILPGGAGSGPGSLVQMGTFVVFDANDGISGDELWKSDGTAAGTSIIKEIVPGYIGGSINRLISTGTKVYFSANTAINAGNYELYKSDGTVAGTGLVKEIDPSPFSGGIAGSVFTWGETLYFAGNDGANGLELWKSDGTLAGTTMIKDIYTGNTGGLPNGGNPSNFCVMNNKLYFTAFDGNGVELWVTDGTAANTLMVKDINPASGNASPSQLTALGNTLYFRANDGTNGTELWKSDGTAIGTVMVEDINSGSGASNPAQLTVMGSSLYFQANDNSNGAELWKSNGTAANTILLKDINPGATGSLPANITTNGTYLLLSADNGINGTELWKSDGTAANTALLKNINPDNGQSAVANLTALGNQVIFAANNGINGTEIWRTDGTAAGTILLSDINTATAGASGNPLQLTKLGSNIIFSATSGATATGNEVYKTDGTTTGTTLLKDINTGTGNSSPRNYTAHGSYLYFSASQPATGQELWRTDGTEANTVIVKDITSGSGGSSPGSSGSIPDMISSGSMLFFAGLNQNAGEETGWELYGSTGAIGNGALIKDINTTSFAANSAPSNFAYPGTGNTVYFTADDGINGDELWKSDGTAGGTVIVKDITPGAQGTTYSRLIVLAGKIYFTAYSATAGLELWQSDGTTAGTIVLKDINAGTASSAPQGLTVCGNNIYFSADNGTTGRELWRTDGTVAGTVQVSDIVAGSGSSNPANFFYHPTLQSVFFSAYTPANGTELWEYDGTSSSLYTEVVTGTGSSNPGPVMLAGNNLVFVGTNGSNGLELYGVETYNSWAGTTNSTWSTATNWKKNLVPGSSESALLPATGVTNEAALDVNATLVRLEIETGRTLTINASKTMNVTDLIFNNGTIKGSGSLTNPDFINTGTIAPGNSPGILSLTGNFTNQGTLQIELGGTTPGTGYDRLAVSGNVTLGGTLIISKLTGFNPVAGQNFTFITGSTVTGTFSTVTWPVGITGTIIYTANSATINIATALPLSLVSFTGHALGKQTILDWTTASEKNTRGFELQRSPDGKTFKTLASIPALGKERNQYQEIDALPENGNNYYRLKIIDQDGSFTHSTVVLVVFDSKGSLSVSPVPAHDYIDITFTAASYSGGQATVFNAAGTKVMAFTLKPGMRIDISNWAAGVYTLKAGTATCRFVKQ